MTLPVATLFRRIALALFVLGSLAVGAWWGFPVQDDAYVIRLLRMGGPDFLVQQHPDRPVAGFLIGTSARLAGGHPAVYIAIGLLGWSLLLAEAAGLWALLFPEWSAAWPAVALAAAAPVVTRVQFSTVTTVVPCVLPVVLVLAAALLLLRRPEAERPLPRHALAAVLVTSAVVISEYGIAAALASAALLLVLRRWRSAAWLLGGLPVGYAIFQSISDVALRMETNPGVQLEKLLARPWSPPFQLATSVWSSTVGSWGRAVSDLAFEWSSKSTLLAALVALGVAAILAPSFPVRDFAGSIEGLGRRLVALFAASAAGLFPSVAIWGWPRPLIFETRYQLPALAFACCATVALLLALAQPKYRKLALLAFVSLAADWLVQGAFEEKRLEEDLERFGESVRPFIRRSEGLVVVVAPEHTTRQSALEVMGKTTAKWSADEADRLWIETPDVARPMFGPRSACRNPESLRLEPTPIRWPRAAKRVTQVLWMPWVLDSRTAKPEPYFSGCAGKSAL